VNIDCKLCGISQIAAPAAKEARGSIAHPRRDMIVKRESNLGTTKLRFRGVSRIEEEPLNLMLAFNRPLTDREFITIHELLMDYAEDVSR